MLPQLRAFVGDAMVDKLARNCDRAGVDSSPLCQYSLSAMAAFELWRGTTAVLKCRRGLSANCTGTPSLEFRVRVRGIAALKEER